MSIEIEARGEREAQANVLELKKLLEEPFVRLTIQSKGIRLVNGDGRPVVYAPKREPA
jgi:hypothetical protein